MNVQVRVHEDFDLGGGFTLAQGIHDVPREDLPDYEPEILNGNLFFPLEINQFEALNQQLNEQILNLYKSDLDIAALVPPFDITSPTAHDLLTFDGVNWINVARPTIAITDFSGTVPINRGGTGQTTANAALNAFLPTQTGNSGKFLQTDATNSSWATVPAATPAGSNTQVQYNNSGAFGASANFVYDGHLKINTGTSQIQFGASDASAGTWLRNDGSNAVLSTKQSNFYMGYGGTAGLTWLFYAGNTPSEVLRMDNNRVLIAPGVLLRSESSAGGQFAHFTNGSDANFVIDVSASGAGDKYSRFLSTANTRVAFGANSTEIAAVYPGGYFGIGTGSTTPSAGMQVRKTSTQAQFEYDGSNYVTISVASDGSTVWDVVGSVPKTTFNDPVLGPINAYGSGWNGSAKFVTEDAAYDKIQSMTAPTNLWDIYADAGNTGTSDTILHLGTIAANTFTANGNKLTAEYALVFVSSATATRQITIYYEGNLIFDSGALSVAVLSDCSIEILMIRESSSAARFAVKAQTSIAIPPQYTRLTGLDFTSTNDLQINGMASGVGASSGDIILKMAVAEFKP